MARMLGRVEAPGCCPGSRSGWTRRRNLPGPDCSGADTNTRRAKRVEQRAFRRSLLPEGQLPPPGIVDEWDCRHGCNGDCLTYGGTDSPCRYTCHPQISNEDVARWSGRLGV